MGKVTTATPSHHALARWLLTTEVVGAEGPLAAPAAAERVFEKLSKRLAQLITLVGSDALLTRAVHLSRVEFPFLDGAQITRSDDSLTLSLRFNHDRLPSCRMSGWFCDVAGGVTTQAAFLKAG